MNYSNENTAERSEWKTKKRMTKRRLKMDTKGDERIRLKKKKKKKEENEVMEEDEKGSMYC